MKEPSSLAGGKLIEQRQPSLAGRESELVMEEGAPQPSTTTTGSYTPSTTGTNTTTTTTTVVGGEEGATTKPREQKHQLPITKFYERVPPKLADSSQQSGPVLASKTNTFDDKDEMTRSDVLRPRRSSIFQEVPATPVKEEDRRGEDCIVVSREESTAPPSTSMCSYTRGTCSIHGRKGERYLQESKSWKDRGGGRGFGWVTRRVVRYRCIMNTMNTETLPEESLPRSSSQ